MEGNIASGKSTLLSKLGLSSSVEVSSLTSDHAVVRHDVYTLILQHPLSVLAYMYNVCMGHFDSV